MDQKLQYDRQLRDVANPAQSQRESAIRRIQASYGYDHENAEKVYEIMRVKQVEQLWGLACGSLAAYKWMPLQREMEASNAILRKQWMRYPILAGVFGFAYFVGLQLPVRFFQKLTHRNEGITAESYKGKHDLVGRFRLFETSSSSSAEDQLLDHLSMYDKDPLSKPELLEHMVKRIQQQTDLSQVFRVKRQGKDANPIFWAFGKIHGLENIAFCDPAEVAKVQGNPFKLQKLINQVKPEDRPGFSSYQDLQDNLQGALADYKASVEKLNLYPSDKKKLLSLPFFLAKRSENPEPRRGQPEFELFKELYGEDYHAYSSVETDLETKITEFDYENYLSPALLENVDTKTDDFKELVRKLNYVSQTKVEAHKAKKEQFRELQNVLSGLNAEEQRALIHLIKNRDGDRKAPGSEITETLMDQVVDKSKLERLAKISEEENYALKNRYKHQKETMNFAEKKRMPVDERSVRDMLRNQHIFRNKLQQELPTYAAMLENDQFENGLLTYLSEGSYGELGELVKEVGIKRDTIPFYNLTQFRQYKDNLVHDSDSQFQYFMSALFTPTDMTDYETNFVGWNELPGAAPVTRPNWLTQIAPEPHPQLDALASIEEIEDIPRYATSQTMVGIIGGKYAEAEEEEEEFYGSEGGDDDEYGDEDEEGEEGGEEEYGDYDEEEETEEWPPKDVLKSRPMEDRFFRTGETLRGKYNEVEIDSFMKLLGVKPRTQWQDTSTHHYKLGLHAYEDEAQEIDSDFHLLSETERRQADIQKTKEWRSGSEVKMVVDGRKPLAPQYRF